MMLATVSALLTLAVPMEWQRDELNFIDPAVYRSPSGQYKLFVNPADRFGGGSCYYSLSRAGKILWQKQMPYTLFSIVVTDDGSACGYTEFSVAKIDYLHILILGADGKERLHDKLKKNDSAPLHSAPNPNVDALVASSEADTLLVALENTPRELRTYRISTGQRFLSPLAKPLVRVGFEGRYRIGMKYVPGTKLLLVNWWNPVGRASDAQFELLDPAAKLVWRFDRLGDYVLSEKENDPHDASGIQTTGAILSVEKNTFSIRLLRDDLKLKFNVRSINGKRSVAQVQKARFTPERKTPIPYCPVVKLTELRPFRLVKPHSSPVQEISEVSSFCTSGEKRFAYIKPGGQELIEFSTSGNVLKRHKLPSLKGGEVWGQVAYLGENRYVVSADGSKSPSPASLWVFNGKTGASKKIISYPDASIGSINSNGDGKFVYLLTSFHRYSMSDTLIVADFRGKVIWSTGGSGIIGPEDQLFSPESVAFFRDGSVGVLDVIRHDVQIFDTKGKFSRKFNLDKAWKQKAVYPTELVAKRDGGFLVQDSEIIWSMSSAGNLEWSASPKVNGHALKSRDIAWNNSGLWVSDGYSVYLVSKQGKVVKTVGESEQPTKLGAISEVAINSAGYIFAVDERTESVHCFDPTGKWLRVHQPIRSGVSWYMSQEFADRVLVGTRDNQEGKRAIDFFLDKTGLLMKSASKTREYVRRSDGTWLREYRVRGFAANDEVVVADPGDRSKPGPYLCFFAASGKPTSMAHLPSSMKTPYTVGFDGKNVLLVDEPYLYCFNRAGKPIWKAKFDGAEVTLVKGVIYAFNRENKLRRFKMPILLR